MKICFPVRGRNLAPYLAEGRGDLPWSFRRIIRPARLFSAALTYLRGCRIKRERRFTRHRRAALARWANKSAHQPVAGVGDNHCSVTRDRDARRRTKTRLIHPTIG